MKCVSKIGPTCNIFAGAEKFNGQIETFGAAKQVENIFQRLESDSHKNKLIAFILYITYKTDPGFVA